MYRTASLSHLVTYQNKSLFYFFLFFFTPNQMERIVKYSELVVDHFHIEKLVRDSLFKLKVV